MVPENIIFDSLSNCIEQADGKGCQSISIPLLECKNSTISSVIQNLCGTFQSLKVIRVVCTDKVKLNSFITAAKKIL